MKSFYETNYLPKVKKLRAEYSGETLTTAHYAVVERMVDKKVPIDLDDLVKDDDLRCDLYDMIWEAISMRERELVEEAYKIGFHFARHTIMKDILTSEHDDF